MILFQVGCLSHIVQYSLVTRIYESLFYFEFSIVLWQSYIFTTYTGLDMMLLYSPQIPTRAMIGKQTPSAHQSTARPSSSMDMLRLGLEMSMAWFNSLLHRHLDQSVNEQFKVFKYLSSSKDFVKLIIYQKCVTRTYNRISFQFLAHYILFH